MKRPSFTGRAGIENAAARLNEEAPNLATAGGRPDTESAPPVAFHLGHRPSLDGLRGVAILCVLACHLTRLSMAFGFIGVVIFFVLSGFLITSLLLEEWGETGQISLKAFYARRALRLLPALVALLAAYLAYGTIVHSHKSFVLDVRHSLATLLYFMNWATIYYTQNIVFLRHAWSLSIEEQFYLLWPTILLILLLRVPRATMLPCVLLAWFLPWLTRCLLFLGTAADANRLYAGTDTRADALLLGCSISVLLFFGLLPRSRGFTLVLRYGSAISAAGLALIGFVCMIFTPFMFLLGWSLVAFFSGLILLEIMTAPVSPLRNALENPVLQYFGKISYGLYLWHWPVLVALEELFPKWPFWEHALVSGSLSFAVTLLSYYFVEQPCLRLKRRFQRVEAADAFGASAQPSAA